MLLSRLDWPESFCLLRAGFLAATRPEYFLQATIPVAGVKSCLQQLSLHYTEARSECATRE